MTTTQGEEETEKRQTDQGAPKNVGLLKTSNNQPKQRRTWGSNGPDWQLSNNDFAMQRNANKAACTHKSMPANAACMKH